MTIPTNYIYPPVTQDPGALYDAFTAFMQAHIPNWQPFSGELDDWLARAFTAIGAQLMEIESDVATSIFRYFGAYILNYPPFDATPAVGSVTVTVKDSTGYQIPAFTSFSFPDASGNLQGFENLTQINIPSGQTSVTVPMQAMTPGSAGNGCSGSGDLDSSTPITFITGLSMAASSNGGTDAEEDQAYLNRLSQLMTTITPSPVTVEDFTTIAMTQPGVGRAFTIGAFNPASWTVSGAPTNSGSPNVGMNNPENVPIGAPLTHPNLPAGSFAIGIIPTNAVIASQNATTTGSGPLTIDGQLNQGGYVASWVVDSNGEALDSGTLSAIQTAIQAMCLANVVYTAHSPTYTNVDVTATVVAWADSDNPTTAVQAAVEAAITNFLSPSTFLQLGVAGEGGWMNETVVRIAALQTVIMNVPGVHYATVQIDGASNDLPLPGIVPLPHPGTITVNVTTG